MNILIAAAATVTIVAAGLVANQHWPDPQMWGGGALKLFTLWCLSFLPGWLYVRFLGMRAKALWNEYVLNLHRLGWDRPWHLPEPPVNSEFHAQWEKLATAVFAVGWAAVLWDTRFFTAPSGAWDVLKYGFLGSYAFVTGMLIRRFFQSDLRPSAYASSVFRIILVLLIVAVLHQVIGGASPVSDHAELATAFIIGFFPLVGLQALQRVTSKVLRRFVPPVTSEYPLDQLDGFNLWYEARLTEEGVEDMQNLTTMNLVDVILHTRVPAGRLVDWIDQAFLLIHLERTDRAELNQVRQREQRAAGADTAVEPGAESGAQARVKLRRVGIRTATDLLKAFSGESDQPGGVPPRRFVPPADVKLLPLPEDQLRLLVAILGAEPGLAPVWNWQRLGVPVCRTAIG